MRKEIIKKDWDYNFYKNEDKYILSVLCGTVGLFEINIQLSKDEISVYKEKGETYIDELAKSIQNSPSSFSNRNLIVDK
ncbi:hypothetical protein EG240_15855 [Paenimyroides tangerinum]|uniref:Uncharacterized protein n=1 Tax=Paenimyroides tangerinum TaxID=2488728 RepID=A0A3P3VW67_9FLAO|nr:hypothetical protein [Paenimyroides tangerinum]RRJ86694.1 hypothetical protein EG240_15855 [Paenimyroides tangerinum]